MGNTDTHLWALPRAGMSPVLNTETFKEEKFTLWCGSLILVAFDLKILH
jgi:hypothetical protein